MNHEIFKYATINELKQKIHSLGLSIPLSNNTGVLTQPLQIGSKTLPNRFIIQPMEGCDGTSDGKPDFLTKRRYDRFARSGAGLIWFEAVAIVKEGRANPRQLYISENTLDSFKSIVNEIKETGLRENGFEPIVIIQATHSGRYSKPNGYPEPIVAHNNPNFENNNALNKDRIIQDDQLKELEQKFGEAAKLAQTAGFDGIDIKCCHGYLNNELLSAYDRSGEYGGSFENRTRLLRNGIISAQSNVSSEFIVTSRLSVYDGYCYPFGFGVNEKDGLKPDMTEPIKLIDILHNQLKLSLLNITIGNPYANPHVNRPYDHGSYIPDEHPLQGVNRIVSCTAAIQNQFPDLNIIGSGLSYLRQYSMQYAAGAIENGYFKLAGFGRESFAYPEFVKDFLTNGEIRADKCCITCGKCTELMRAGSKAGCVVRDKEVYLPLYKQYVLNK